MSAVFGALLSYILCLLAILFVTGFLVYRVKFKHMIDITRNIPSPPSWPLIGHGHYFLRSPPHQNVQRLFDWVAIYGTTFKMWLGPHLNIVLVEPADVEQVVSNTRFIEKSYHYSFLQPWLKGGLLISGGKKWHQRRKIFTPAFHFQILKQFVDIFQAQSRILLKNLDLEYEQQREEEEEEKGFDLHKWLKLCSLDVMCVVPPIMSLISESVMGVSINAQTNVDSEYAKALHTIRTVLHKRMFDLLYHFDFTFQFTKLSREWKSALAVIHGFSEKVILRRQEELLSAKIPREPESKKQKMIFLDILLRSEIDGKPLSNADIREEVDTFMFAGHDAPTAGLLFNLYNLARYPECQRKCVAEIVGVIGKDNSKPFTYDDLNRLPYLEQCIKETLRLFPSVPVMGRYITEDCEINGKTIPAGSNICLSTLAMGRQASVFPQPLLFKPERFDNSAAAATLNPFAYIPFAAGPRNCIGQRFAMLALKTILANALRHYEFEWLGNRDEELQLIAEMVLLPKDPLMFKIKPRVL